MMILTATRGRNSRTGRRWRPGWDDLEGRTLLAVDPGYVLSGASWSDPSRITFSFPPDGIAWDGGINALNATFNARFGVQSWQDEIARAIQTWASVANLNAVEVADGGQTFDAPGLSQGDSRFGDIRIGGSAFTNANTLAQTYFPSPGGSTESGDSDINTSVNFSIGGGGGTFDLYSVMLHELGHSLGLEHAAEPVEVMNPVYQGVRAGLSAGDVAGIQAIHGARTADAYQSQGQATSFSTAEDLTSGLDGWGQETVRGTSLFTIGDTEYFRVVAPASATGFQVTASADGISLFRPQVSLLDSNLQPLAHGDNANAALGSVVPGQTYYVTVTGATHDVFATGAYQLVLGFSGVSPPPALVSAPMPVPVILPAPIAVTPVVTSNPVATPPASPAGSPSAPVSQPATTTTVAPDRFQGNNRLSLAAPLGVVVNTMVPNLSISSTTAAEFFTFRVGRRGVYRVSAPAALIRIQDAHGHVLGSATGIFQLKAPRAGGKYTVSLASPAGGLVASTSLSLSIVVPPRLVSRVRRR